jgi:hypothetical protein
MVNQWQVMKDDLPVFRPLFIALFVSSYRILIDQLTRLKENAGEPTLFFESLFSSCQ